PERLGLIAVRRQEEAAGRGRVLLGRLERLERGPVLGLRLRRGGRLLRVLLRLPGRGVPARPAQAQGPGEYEDERGQGGGRHGGGQLPRRRLEHGPEVPGGIREGAEDTLKSRRRDRSVRA